ncbi:MAG: CHASE2 domain-containing protein [Gammaproteobacteria bacterium]|nr:CHASE2 domain-containing protein [Gammaproteobacteria bacterium]
MLPLYFFLAATIFNWAATQLELLNVLELRNGDFFFRLRNQVQAPAPPDNIVIVAIDEASMQEFGIQWPWPRKRHADLVQALAEAGAAVIAFDVLFVEPMDKESVRHFAQTIMEAGNVILAEDHEVVEEKQYRFETSVRSLPLLREAAKSTGLVSIYQDADGFVRRVFLRSEGTPAFGQTIARAYRSRRGEQVDPVDPFFW